MSLELFVGLGRTLSIEVEREVFEGVPSLGDIAGAFADRLEDRARATR